MNSSKDLYVRTEDIFIRHFENRDTEFIYDICANEEILHLWAPHTENLSLEKFKKKLERRIAFRWDHYRVIERCRDRQIIGFAYCYNTIPENETTYVCICIDKPYMSSLISMRTAYLYFSHLFMDKEYRKLYAEVYDYNKQCKQLLEKVGFEQEGCLKEHQLWSQRYWDLYLFTLTRDNYKKLCEENLSLVKRLSCISQKN